MALNIGLLFITLATGTLLFLLKSWQAAKLANPQGLPYPPGPKPLPIIGNLVDLVCGDLWEKFDLWAKEYGDLVHLSIMGRHFVFVNSHEVANELFDKRSANHSDREHLTMICDLMGWEWSFGHMPYGDRWKSYRKMFHRQFQPSSIANHHHDYLRAARRLLLHTFDNPDGYVDHLKYHAGSTIMKVVYDIESKTENDPYIATAESALASMAIAAEPGSFLVDIFPALRHVPAWIPGAGFQRLAQKWKRTVCKMRDAPFEETQRAMASGSGSPCFVSDLLSEVEASKSNTTTKQVEVEMIKGCAGMAYAAATESTVSLLHSFLLAMILYPDVQTRAREEIDSVVQKQRLPEFSDRDTLPYTNAMVKELLRWAQVAPVALPHKVTNHDTYAGYFIKAGTTIVGNARGILHDAKKFPDPYSFNPGRFYGGKEKVQDTSAVDFAFGFGRRICPGRFMADAELWIVMVSMLSVFVMSAVDGQETPKAEFTKGMLSNPVPFKFKIEPRKDYPAPPCIISTSSEASSSSSTAQHSSPLSLPAPQDSSRADAIDLDVASPNTVKLDELGPLVVNSDGTLSRVANWAEMTESEKERTFRVLSKRNKIRLENEQQKLDQHS